ncbi:MAG: Hsp33 family molecular chaperone [Filomicrobium sp.]
MAEAEDNNGASQTQNGKTDLANGNPEAQIAGDDAVLPFQTVRSGMAGRIVKLGPSLDQILSRHDYPDPVSETLGQALTLTSMLGAALKINGRLTLQTKSDGALDLLVVNYDTPGHLRGYASFDGEKLPKDTSTAGPNSAGASASSPTAAPDKQILGDGYLALTIDPGGDMDRYQGIVALESESLSSAALTYFRQSEQLPTFIRLAVARVFEPDKSANGSNEPNDETASEPQGRWTWRAGGLMLQHVASTGGTAAPEQEGEALPLSGEDDEDWRRTHMLASTVEDHELTDPDLPAEDLLYRLFHEEGVRVQTPHRVQDQCKCSRERVTGFLDRFAAEGIDDLREPDGAIVVTCEFCNEKYRFEKDEIG